MSLFGIDKNYLTDFFIGVGVAIGFIVITFLSPGIATIGLPNVSSIAGTIGKILIIVGCASIFESFLFQEFALDFFNSKLKAPYFIASIIASLMFSSFHFFAYGESLSALSGSFFSAFLVSFGWCYLRKWTKSLLPVIVCHAILNAYLLSKLAVVIG